VECPKCGYEWPINKDVLIELFNSGLTYLEMQSAFNCNKSLLTYYIEKYNLKREKPKSDFHNRYKSSRKHGSQISQLKGTKLKKCLNPECNFYYYGQKRDRYCSKKCANRVNNVANKKINIHYFRTTIPKEAT